MLKVLVLRLFDLGNYTMDISSVQNSQQNPQMRCKQYVLEGGSDLQSFSRGKEMLIP